ncbi:AzlC family ABC transporter permease [Yoonia sp. R2331]|uniref:AzlC family ABC transporter permease n=1 Tax=Yoonia sp. R2331 TaxID=3237238 RepID=UPI0034E387D8
MTAATVKSVYKKGLRDGAPFLLMALPFATFFGVAAAEAGLQLAQIFAFSLLVIAGASQFAALQMMIDNAAIALVLLAALAVNLRMAMYSAALVPHLGAAPLWQRALVAYINFDQSYMQSMMEYEKRPDLSPSLKAWYFLGVASLISPAWVIATVVGALIGKAIPPEWALDFVVPIMFMAMVGPMLKSLAHVAAALTSCAVALALLGLPSGMGLIVAAFCAMGVGAAVETWMERQ